MPQITYINPRAARHAHDLRGDDLYFMHIANERHDKAVESNQRTEHIAIGLCIVTAVLILGMIVGGLM